MSNEEILELSGSFGWDFGEHFFIETSSGNYVWSDPEYGGDNTLRRYDGPLKQWLRAKRQPYVRDKGVHRIRDYCGADVKVVE